MQGPGQRPSGQPKAGPMVARSAAIGKEKDGRIWWGVGSKGEGQVWLKGAARLEGPDRDEMEQGEQVWGRMGSVWDVVVAESQGHWYPRKGVSWAEGGREGFPAEEAVRSAFEGGRPEGEDLQGGSLQSPAPMAPGRSEGARRERARPGREAEGAGCPLPEQQQPAEFGS